MECECCFFLLEFATKFIFCGIPTLFIQKLDIQQCEYLTLLELISSEGFGTKYMQKMCFQFLLTMYFPLHINSHIIVKIVDEIKKTYNCSIFYYILLFLARIFLQFSQNSIF